MEESRNDLVTQLLIRYIAAYQLPAAQEKTLVTIASLYHGAWSLAEIDGTKRDIDLTLLCGLASFASPVEAATFIWSAVGMKLPTDEFVTLYNRCLRESSDLAVIWQVLGAGVSFSQIRGIEIAAPTAAVESLLRSDDVEHRVVGMKAMFCTELPLESLLRYILVGLEKSDCYERAGAICSLLTLIDSVRRSFIPHINIQLLSGIVRRLNEICMDPECAELKSSAAAARDWLTVEQK